MDKLRKLGASVAGAVAAANAVAGVLTWADDGRLQTIQIGALKIFDRRRWEARQAARAARKRRG